MERVDSSVSCGVCGVLAGSGGLRVQCVYAASDG